MGWSLYVPWPGISHNLGTSGQRSTQWAARARTSAFLLSPGCISLAPSRLGEQVLVYRNHVEEVRATFWAKLFKEAWEGWPFFPPSFLLVRMLMWWLELEWPFWTKMWTSEWRPQTEEQDRRSKRLWGPRGQSLHIWTACHHTRLCHCHYVLFCNRRPNILMHP